MPCLMHRLGPHQNAFDGAFLFVLKAGSQPFSLVDESSHFQLCLLLTTGTRLRMGSPSSRVLSCEFSQIFMMHIRTHCFRFLFLGMLGLTVLLAVFFLLRRLKDREEARRRQQEVDEEKARVKKMGEKPTCHDVWLSESYDVPRWTNIQVRLLDPICSQLLTVLQPISMTHMPSTHSASPVLPSLPSQPTSWKARLSTQHPRYHSVLALLPLFQGPASATKCIPPVSLSSLESSEIAGKALQVAVLIKMPSPPRTGVNSTHSSSTSGAEINFGVIGIPYAGAATAETGQAELVSRTFV